MARSSSLLSYYDILPLRCVENNYDVELKSFQHFFNISKQNLRFQSSYLMFKDHRACVLAKPDAPTPTEKSDLKMIKRWRLADSDHDNRLNMLVNGNMRT